MVLTVMWQRCHPIPAGRRPDALLAACPGNSGAITAYLQPTARIGVDVLTSLVLRPTWPSTCKSGQASALLECSTAADRRPSAPNQPSTLKQCMSPLAHSRQMRAILDELKPVCDGDKAMQTMASGI